MFINSNNLPCSSSSSDDSDVVVPVDEMNPTELLSLAIKKRRSLYNRKERDYRCELLQTSFITSLCKHMGESRKRRRRGGKKRSRTDLSDSDSANVANSDSISVEVEPIFNGEPLVQTASQSQDEMNCPQSKRRKVEEYADPFGLDDFFKQMRSGTTKGSKLETTEKR